MHTLLSRAPMPFHNSTYWHNVALIQLNGIGVLQGATQPVRNSNLRNINGVPPMAGGTAGFSVPMRGPHQ